MHVTHSIRSTASRTRLAVVVAVSSLVLAACGGTEVDSTQVAALDDAPTSAAPTPDPVTSETPASDPVTSEGTASDPVTEDTAAAQPTHDHGDTASGHETMATSQAMTASLDVTADAKAGWNVHIETSGFTWAPEDASTEAVDGAGHAHLYIDGDKWGRVYTPWLHVAPDLAPGAHTFRVTLNANDHRDFAVDGEPVAATTTIDVPEPADGAGHMHADTMPTATDMAVAVEASLDAKQGVNVHVTTTDFTWAPEHASGGAADGEGHAHLYLDGEKVGRLYGEWFHVGDDLAPGEHEVRVTLNANDHRDYTRDGEVVEATATVMVPA